MEKIAFYHMVGLNRLRMATSPFGGFPLLWKKTKAFYQINLSTDSLLVFV